MCECDKLSCIWKVSVAPLYSIYFVACVRTKQWIFVWYDVGDAHLHSSKRYSGNVFTIKLQSIFHTHTHTHYWSSSWCGQNGDSRYRVHAPPFRCVPSASNQNALPTVQIKGECDRRVHVAKCLCALRSIVYGNWILMASALDARRSHRSSPSTPGWFTHTIFYLFNVEGDW